MQTVPFGKRSEVKNVQNSMAALNVLKNCKKNIVIFGAGIVGRYVLEICRRQGIHVMCFCDNKLTHKEIATQLNLSTQRVQQIEQESLKKLQKFFI